MRRTRFKFTCWMADEEDKWSVIFDEMQTPFKTPDELFMREGSVAEAIYWDAVFYDLLHRFAKEAR